LATQGQRREVDLRDTDNIATLAQWRLPQNEVPGRSRISSQTHGA